MAWITPTATDYAQCGFHPAEFAAILSAQNTTGLTGEEVFAQCVTDLVDHIRGVLGRGHCTLGVAGTIPQELLRTFQALLRRDLVNSLPSLDAVLMRGGRTQLALEAVNYLAEIAKDARGFSIPEEEAPDDEQPASSGGATLVQTTDSRRRANTNGLL